MALKIFIASAILRATVATSLKVRFAWDSGLAIARVIALLMPTPDTFQCPGSLSKRFLEGRLRSFMMRYQLFKSAFCEVEL